MIVTDVLSPDAVRIELPDHLAADDFARLAPQLDGIIQKQGKIRLLIDATRFHGWDGLAAFEHHIGFVKDHQQKIERIAVVAAQDWQHWLIGAVRVLVHPQVQAFDQSHERDALQWILS